MSMKKSPDPYRTTVTVKEEGRSYYAFRFPKSRFPSPLQLFWERHRDEETDLIKRKQMDEAMEKYV